MGGSRHSSFYIQFVYKLFRHYRKKMPGTIVCASGYFDPIHPGHIEYLERSKQLGDKLYVIVNNDEQATMKKGQPFMKIADRLKIVRSLSCVDAAIEACDKDRSVCESLRII